MHRTDKLKDIFRGDDKAYTIHVRDKQSNDDIDISGWKFYFTLKKDIHDSDADAIIRKDIEVHTDPVNGKTILLLTNTDTEIEPGKYYYDLQVKDAANHITTLLSKVIIIKKDVTRRNA